MKHFSFCFHKIKNKKYWLELELISFDISNISFSRYSGCSFLIALICFLFLCIFYHLIISNEYFMVCWVYVDFFCYLIFCCCCFVIGCFEWVLLLYLCAAQHQTTSPCPFSFVSGPENLNNFHSIFISFHFRNV